MGATIGSLIIDRIIAGGLMHASCAHDLGHGCVVTWSSVAAEQLDALILKAARPDFSQTLWAVKSPMGELNHTTLSCREDYAIKEWMNQEQTATRTLCGHPVPSWEGYEAQGYSCVRCILLERPI